MSNQNSNVRHVKEPWMEEEKFSSIHGSFCLSASRAGRFYLHSQTLSSRFGLTGKLTGKPKDNGRF
jgi:hypothetical protein